MNRSEALPTAPAAALTLVTGATGHIGNVLVRELLRQGRPVRTLLLPGEDATPLAGLAVERVVADVRDPGSLVPPFRGVGLVFHLAGLIAIVPGRGRLMNEINVVGTRNVVSAAIESGVRRLVYTSSVHAFTEPPPDRRTCEGTAIDPGSVLGAYGRSKARATHEVLAGMLRGLDAVIVFPSGVIGPYDFRRSEMGRLVIDFALGRLPAYVDGAYDFVDVRDVAQGLILAAEHGRKGEGYLLTGSVATVRGILDLLQELTGVPGPRLRLPYCLARLLALASPLCCRLTGRRPRFTTYSLQVLRSNPNMDCSKACREIGYTRRTIRESLADSLTWFRGAGMLPAAPGS